MVSALAEAPTGTESREAGTMTWVMLGMMLWSAGIVLAGKRLPVSYTSSRRLRIALAPTLFACAAVFIDSPMWILWVGAGISMALAGWILVTAQP
jgi:hypothetical protein